MNIVLASQSVYRRQLMDQLHIPYTALSPLADEEVLKKTAGVALLDLPLFLAQKKAESLIAKNPGGITIGSDQMAVLGSERFDKPGTKENAVTQLMKLQGQTHKLLTALAVHFQGQWELTTVVTELKMKALSETQIRRYVDIENPIDCAGAYKIEKLGIVLFEDIRVQDPTAIVGLPLIALTRILEKWGAPVLK